MTLDPQTASQGAGLLPGETETPIQASPTQTSSTGLQPGETETPIMPPDVVARHQRGENPNAVIAEPTNDSGPAGVADQISRGGIRLGTGAVKGMADTIHTAGAFLHDKLGIPMPDEVMNPELAGGTDAKNSGEAAGKFGEAVGEFFLGDEAVKGLSISERLGMAQKVMKISAEHPFIAKALAVGMKALRQGSVGAGAALVKGATPGQALETGAAVAGGSAALDTVAAGASALKPVVQDAIKGESVAQPAAQAALRTNPWAAARAANQSLSTTLDAPIEKAAAARQSAYNLLDNSAGTDVKALYSKLENTEYQIRQLTDTQEDVQKEAVLEKARTATMDKIAEARQNVIEKLGTKNGPEAFDKADQLFKQEQALKDLQSKVFKNPNIVQGNTAAGTPETVNVDSAVKALQKMQNDTSYGSPRLEQAIGKDSAKKMLADLYAAQRAGQKAISRQDFAKLLAGHAARVAEVGGPAAVVYGVAKHAIQP